MAEVRNYKITGRFPNEGMTFKNGIRIEFKAFHYSTSNPIEIATIEGSDYFKGGKKLKRVDRREVSKTGPSTTDQVATTTPFSQDPGERIAFEQEKAKFEAEKAEFAKMRVELDAGKNESSEDQAPSDPPPPPGDEGEGVEEGKVDAGSKKKDSKSK